MEKFVHRNLESVTASQIMDIQDFFELRQRNMEMLATYDLVQDAVLISLGEKEAEEFSYDYLQNLLEERREFTKGVLSLSVVDKDFKVVASSEDVIRGEISELAFFNPDYLKGDFRIGNLYQREIDGEQRTLVAIYVGIFRNEELIGYFVEEIPASYFDQYRVSAALSEYETIYIFDGLGQIVTAGTVLEEKSEEQLAISKNDASGYLEKWNEIDWEENPQGEFTYAVGKQKYSNYYSSIANSDWKISINADLNAYMNNMDEFIRNILIGTVCYTIIILIVSYYLSYRMAKPLERISRVLENIRVKKDYTLRLNEKRKDEFGILARDIDELLEFVEETHNIEIDENRDLQRRADRDSLTGKYNKAAIDVVIENMIAKARQENGRIAVGFVDIDDFKNFNTVYGHQMGDKVIQFVANTISDYIGDAVGRNGGDEFLFCINENKMLEDANKLLEEIRKCLNNGIVLNENDEPVGISCSIGVVVMDANLATKKGLILAADKVMYQVKKAGKNNFQIKKM